MSRMKDTPRKPSATIRVVLAPDVVIGPGKADLLEGIRETGSISAAGRRMKMSYKRAWHLIDSMNTCFHAAVVETVKGGAAGGGARLTPLGEEVLAHYRRMQALTANAVSRELAELSRLLRARAR